MAVGTPLPKSLPQVQLHLNPHSNRSINDYIWWMWLARGMDHGRRLHHGIIIRVENYQVYPLASRCQADGVFYTFYESQGYEQSPTSARLYLHRFYLICIADLSLMVRMHLTHNYSQSQSFFILEYVGARNGWCLSEPSSMDFIVLLASALQTRQVSLAFKCQGFEWIECFDLLITVSRTHLLQSFGTLPDPSFRRGWTARWQLNSRGISTLSATMYRTWRDFIISNDLGRLEDI